MEDQALAGSERMDYSSDEQAAGENPSLNASEIPIIPEDEQHLVAEFEPRPCSSSTSVGMDMEMDTPAAAVTSSDSTTSSSSNHNQPLRRNSNNNRSFPGIELPPGILDDPMEDVLSGGGDGTAASAAASNNNNNIDSLLLADEQKMEDIEKPHNNDVLCGRGVTTNRWVGNENFRAIVGLNKEMYVTSTKRQKMAISRSIVEAVRSLNPPGRFLDKDPQTGLWYDVGHKKAVEKTSQALRDGAAMLRKQLSADLGDPDFLNSVFDEDSSSNSEESQRKAAADKKGKGSGKENNKGKSPEKIKPIKAKSSAIKKGHRRVRSNPSVLGQAVKAAARRGRIEEPLEDSGRYPPRNYGMFPPTPHSPGPRPPPPRHARSLPNSPMTWGGGPPPSFHPDSPGSFHQPHPPPHHSPYHQPSPSSFSPYGKPASHAPYSRSHSFEYHSHGRPPPPDTVHPSRHHSWSPYGGHPPPLHSPYHGHHHPQPYHHHPPPRSGHYPHSPAGPRPNSPPPAHNKYPSSGYYPTHAPTPEWSPRRVNHHPGQHYSPHCGEYTPTGPSSWTPRGTSPHTHHGHYHHHEDYPEEEYDDGGGLSVPSLGESRSADGAKFSPKVHLTPRMKPVTPRSMQTPPRPPTHSRQRAFSPPTSPNLQRPRSKEERILECSPIKEEKKCTDANEAEEESAEKTRNTSRSEDKKETEKASVVSHSSVSYASDSSVQVDSLPKMESSNGVKRHKTEIELQQRDSPEDIDLKLDDLNEIRASPGLLLSVDEDGNIEAMPQGEQDDATSHSLEHDHVEDIPMSPFAYDREDPISLMDLPDNLMSLPISPCGPNDDPQPGCFVFRC